MTTESNFARDPEFRGLLSRQPDVDLTRAALELARDSYPDLDFQPTLDWIAARADQLRPLVLRSSSEREALSLVAQSLSIEYQITGSHAAYAEADGSFLHRIIDKRRGIPISLSVLYMAVCQGVGIDLTGVASPMHFLTRVESPAGPLFLDAFAGRRILTLEETVEWLTGLTTMPTHVIVRLLEPTDTRTIITRMLTNLKVLFARQENWSAAWPVQQRLVALGPGRYADRRDLALIALKSDHPGMAVRLLEPLLKTCPDDERELLQSQLEVAKKQLHRWN
jgi:regulator of sirC expression with transglutaminase-like and TPR domain